MSAFSSTAMCTLLAVFDEEVLHSTSGSIFRVLLYTDTLQAW